MARETAEKESTGAFAGEGGRADSPPAGEDSGIEALHAQLFRSMMLRREGQQLAMSLSFGMERLMRTRDAAFVHAVRLRFMAIRRRHLASVTRLMLPGGAPAA